MLESDIVNSSNLGANLKKMVDVNPRKVQLMSQIFVDINKKLRDAEKQELDDQSLSNLFTGKKISLLHGFLLTDAILEKFSTTANPVEKALYRAALAESMVEQATKKRSTSEPSENKGIQREVTSLKAQLSEARCTIKDLMNNQSDSNNKQFTKDRLLERAEQQIERLRDDLNKTKQEKTTQFNETSKTIKDINEKLSIRGKLLERAEKQIERLRRLLAKAAWMRGNLKRKLSTLQSRAPKTEKNKLPQTPIAIKPTVVETGSPLSSIKVIEAEPVVLEDPILTLFNQCSAGEITAHQMVQRIYVIKANELPTDPDTRVGLSLFQRNHEDIPDNKQAGKIARWVIPHYHDEVQRKFATLITEYAPYKGIQEEELQKKRGETLTNFIALDHTQNQAFRKKLLVKLARMADSTLSKILHNIQIEGKLASRIISQGKLYETTEEQQEAFIRALHMAEHADAMKSVFLPKQNKKIPILQNILAQNDGVTEDHNAYASR